MKLSNFLSSFLVLFVLAFAVFASPPDIGKTTETIIKAEKAPITTATVSAAEVQTEQACRDVGETITTATATAERFTTNKVCENKRAWSNIDYPIRS